ncbi:MAG: phage/plasmid primase, P4 family [Nanoarchaeota archaeon]
MVIEIPKQLERKDFRFVKVTSKDKAAFEKEWTTKANYPYNDIRLINYIKSGGNYGLLCGEGKLIVIDSDTFELCEWVEKELAETLTVKTGSSEPYKKHYYYLSDNDKKQVLSIIKENGEEIHYGEIQGKGSFVVGPNSIHPSGNPYRIIKDLNITNLNEEDLKRLKERFCSKVILNAEKNKYVGKKFEDRDIENILNLVNIFNIKDLKLKGTSYYYGSHPVHGSTTGQNFHIDASKNIWYCHRCGSGGGIASAIALKEGLKSCPELKGKLDKKTYKNVLKLAEIKYGFKRIVNKFEEIVNKNIISSILDKLDLAKQLYNNQPYFYDEGRNFWFWNNEEKCYLRVDDTSVLNFVDSNSSNINTINSKEKNEILEALRQFGRRKIPKIPKRNWIQFKDEIYDLETGEKFPITYEYFFSNPIPWKMGEDKETPIIDKLLEEWVGKDRVLTLKEIIASSSLNHLPLHRIICLIGGGRNGKDTFVKLITKMLEGVILESESNKKFKNVTSTDLPKLLNSRFEVIKLYKKLVVVIGEIDRGVFNQTRALKALSGETMSSAEYKGKDSIDFINYATPIILTNTLPQTSDTTDGFFSRWCIVDFPNQFEEKPSPVKNIPDYEFENFCAQIPDLIKGLEKRGTYWKEGSIEQRKESYESHSDPLGHFIDNYCKRDVNGEIFFEDFYEEFLNYCKAEKYRIPSKVGLGRDLTKRKFNRKNKTVRDDMGILTTKNCILGLTWKIKEREDKN